MQLRDFLATSAVNLALAGETRDEILAELLASLQMPAESVDIIYRLLLRRENIGSTGVGRGIAIPHCRAPGVDQLKLAFGRKTNGIEYRAIDGNPVFCFFLIVAPPPEMSTQYLPVLGKIAQFAKEADVPARLCEVGTAEALFGLMEEKGA